MKLKHHTINDLGYLQGTLPFLLKILGLLTLLIYLVSCTSLYVLPEPEMAEVYSGEKTLVLLRIECTVDDLSYEPFGMSSWTGEPIVALGIGGFETLGEPRPIVHRFLSEESRRNGWTYYVLSPGAYYLAVLGPESDAIFKTLREAPRWRMDIPENTGFLYAGTIQVKGRSSGRFLFGGKVVKPVHEGEYALKDEHELANSLLIQHFPDSGETKTVLIQRWRQGDTIIIRSPKSR